MLYGVKWSESETKKIYKATQRSEQLMEQLEKKLYENNLVQLAADSPNPRRGYGMMVYYYRTLPNRQLLTAAPRRRQNYIHVVLTCDVINKLELQKDNLTLGNYEDPKPDVKISSEEEIVSLITILKRHNYKFL